VPWNEASRQVSRSFDEWRETDSDVRTYLEMSLRWVQDAYDATWEEAKRDFSQRFDPHRDDPDEYVDVFDRMVGAFGPRTTSGCCGRGHCEML
jgi:hypothetical protein